MAQEDAAGGNLSVKRALLDIQSTVFGLLVKRLNNRADAKDMLQQFSVRVLVRTGPLRGQDEVNARLCAILQSTVNDHCHKSARRGRQVEAVAQDQEVWPEDASAQMSHLASVTAVRSLNCGQSMAKAKTTPRSAVRPTNLCSGDNPRMDERTRGHGPTMKNRRNQ